MASSLTDIETILRAEDLRYTRMDDYIRTSFGTEHYADADGEKSVFLVLKCEEEGEYFKLIAPNLYKLASEKRGAALFQTLLMVSWKTKLIQFEYDEADGEVRAIVEFPLEDAVLSRRQLMRCLHGMVQIVDEYHPIIQRALDMGRVDFSPPSLKPDYGRLAQEYYSYLGLGSAPRGRLILEE